MRLHRHTKQLCVAFVFALVAAFAVLIIAGAITPHAPQTTTPATTAPPTHDVPGPSIAGEPPNVPRGYALVAGINDYPGTGNDLSYCVPDALGVADMLRANGFAPADVTTLVDSVATEPNIAANIAR